MGNDTLWNPGRGTGALYTNQPWLYQNLSRANTTKEPYGYWTSSMVTSNLMQSWGIPYIGFLSNYSISDVNTFGVRPVITISKSILS